MAPVLLLFGWHIVENDLALGEGYRNGLRLNPVARALRPHAAALLLTAGVAAATFSTREGQLFSRVYFGAALIPAQPWLTLDEITAVFLLYHTVSWLIFFEDRVRALRRISRSQAARLRRRVLAFHLIPCAANAVLYLWLPSLHFLVAAPVIYLFWSAVHAVHTAAGSGMSLALLQPVAWSAAFWTALWLYDRRAGPRSARFACALLLGAALAHAGWLLLHAPATWPALHVRPGLLLDPTLGFCVLFLPLGPLLLERSSAAFASLPLALAVARLGCLAAGCCQGARLYEIAGLLALHVAVGSNRALAVPIALGGIGALRLLLDSLRAAPPLGAPLVPATAIAAAWMLVAAALARRRGESRI
jgi:hypothetical protein